MNYFFTTIFFIGLNTLSFSQVGFQKQVNIEYSNAILSSILDQDKIIINCTSSNALNGFRPSMVQMDTFGTIQKILNLIPEPFNSCTSTGSSSKYVAYNPYTDEYDFIYVNLGKIILVTVNKDFTKITGYNSYKYREEFEDSVLPFGVLASEDGYYIYGSMQPPNPITAAWIMLLKLDSNKDIVFWKTVEEGQYTFEIQNGLITGNGNILLSGLKRPFGITFYEFDKNGQITFNKTLSDKQIIYNLIKNTDNTYTAFGHYIAKKIGSVNIYQPAMVKYDTSFKEIKKSFFGLRDEDLYASWGAYEFPYQQAQDKEGNYYAATLSYKRKGPSFALDTTAKEAIVLTKLNADGETIWQSVDTFDKVIHELDEIYIRPRIASVNVSSSGSIYITGQYDDYDTVYFNGDTILSFRSFGFLFKYDKYGCLQSGCRIVSANDELPFSIEQKPTLYPNPTANKIYIKLNTEHEKCTYEIYDATSKLMLSNKLEQDEIDIGLLNTGIYFVVVKQDGRVVFRDKVVKM